MSRVGTTIQSMQEGMKKINDGMIHLQETSFRDIVKEDQLENFVLEDEEADEMSRGKIREYYEEIFVKYEEKVNALVNEKKQLKTFFQNAEDTKKTT